VTDLNSGTKKAESQRDVARRQTGGAESASKPKAVQKTKGEGYQPRLALCQSLGIFTLSENFVRNKKNAEGDDSFDRSGRDVNEAQGRQSERNGVRQRERAHRK